MDSSCKLYYERNCISLKVVLRECCESINLHNPNLTPLPLIYKQLPFRHIHWYIKHTETNQKGTHNMEAKCHGTAQWPTLNIQRGCKHNINLGPEKNTCIVVSRRRSGVGGHLERRGQFIPQLSCGMEKGK